MTTSIIAQIDARIAEAREEAAKLEAARDALVARAASNAPGYLTARQRQALALVESKPGITAAELSRAMGSNSYGYIVVKSLRASGLIEPCERGWQPSTLIYGP